MVARPSKAFLWIMLVGVPLLVGLIFGLLPELQSLRKPALTGEIVFSPQRPVLAKNNRSSPPASISHHESGPPASSGRTWSLDWLWKSFDDLMSWKKNPWRIEPREFGSHFFQLMSSEDPADQARAKELIRLSDAIYRKLLARYPELAVTPRSVPNERNGFLKLLELAERYREKSLPYGNAALPTELDEFLKRTTWDGTAAREALGKEKPLLDEIRKIGLMPERSMTDIDIWRCGYTQARFYKSCADLLLADARIAIENGDPAAALESIRAAGGIASHLGDVETPSLLATTIAILIRSQIQRDSFSTIMPAIASGQINAADWENAVCPQSAASGDFTQVLKGEWNVSSRHLLLPIVMDTADPMYPPDPGALVDAHASYFLQLVQDHEGVPLSQLQSIPVAQQIPDQHLSYRSRQLTSDLAIGLIAWRKGWERVQHQQGLFHAAFAIMKGNPPPADPIHGQPYQWDPATRTLSPPDRPEFKEFKFEPIVIPAP